MNKLELKHLAPYLPYRLSWDISRTEYGKLEKKRLTECILVGLSDTKCLSDIYLKTNILSQNSGLLFFNITVGKPILRPLCDLIKDIEVNEEKFVPVERLYEKWFRINYATYGDKSDKLSHGVFDMIISKVYDEKGYDNLQHWMYQNLIKWHFDVFGLIPKGLAVDINQIK